MRTSPTYLLIFSLLSACSAEGDLETSERGSQPIESDTATFGTIDFDKTLILGQWSHSVDLPGPAFNITADLFQIFYSDTIIAVPYFILDDTIEIMEYRDGHASKGMISLLTRDSLQIRWDTGDENRYVRHRGNTK
jgi:hypothetical protein